MKQISKGLLGWLMGGVHFEGNPGESARLIHLTLPLRKLVCAVLTLPRQLCQSGIMIHACCLRFDMLLSETYGLAVHAPGRDC